jgi:hypothetical protein
LQLRPPRARVEILEKTVMGFEKVKDRWVGRRRGDEQEQNGEQTMTRSYFTKAKQGASHSDVIMLKNC